MLSEGKCQLRAIIGRFINTNPIKKKVIVNNFLTFIIKTYYFIFFINIAFILNIQ